jgi:protoporphyrinogen oxidase
MPDYSIIGSGMAGFGAAHYLNSVGIQPVIYEQRAYYGGHTSSHTVPGGWTFDEGPHISFTKNDRIKKLLAECVGGEYKEFSSRVNNYWNGHWVKHPVQVNLNGLPIDLVTQILLEFSKLSGANEKVIHNYEDWLFASFGETFSKNFPIRYARKYHTTDAKNLSTNWIGGRLYQPNFEEVIRGALSQATEDVHYIPDFRYPTKGGFVSYLKPLTNLGEMRLNHRVVKIDYTKKELTFERGKVEGYKNLISSMPLPELISVIDGVPKDVREAASRLACTELVTVTLGVDRVDLIDAHWTYFYDEDIFFTRLSTPHLQSINNAPTGCGMLQMECYYSKKYRPLDRSIDSCIDPVIRDLKRCGILRDEDNILFRHAMHTQYANVIFDLESAASTALVHQFLDDININYCGRYGDWAYIWTDESFISGENAAKRAFG